MRIDQVIDQKEAGKVTETEYRKLVSEVTLPGFHSVYDPASGWSFPELDKYNEAEAKDIVHKLMRIKRYEDQHPDQERAFIGFSVYRVPSGDNTAEREGPDVPEFLADLVEETGSIAAAYLSWKYGINISAYETR